MKVVKPLKENWTITAPFGLSQEYFGRKIFIKELILHVQKERQLEQLPTEKLKKQKIFIFQ